MELIPGPSYRFRWGPGYRAFGDPYTFIVTATVDGDTATLSGGAGVITVAGARELIRQVRDGLGVKHVQWDRGNHGGWRRVWAK